MDKIREQLNNIDRLILMYGEENDSIIKVFVKDLETWRNIMEVMLKVVEAAEVLDLKRRSGKDASQEWQIMYEALTNLKGEIK
ncbi:hypothetical protein LCGC14_0947140 [marine sediment metagenome]|uniref:Uncharacterized protein n=1 Tax=marine sediment metagenome TaxID=412755 RepID=A0A0F9NIH2_9ZZZZ